MKKIFVLLVTTILALSMTACGDSTEVDTADNTPVATEEETVTESNDDAFSLKPSPDKYTQYVDKYIGMNAASIGYTSLGGDRLVEVGAGLLDITFVTEDGSYVGPDEEEKLKNYVVVAQSIEPNTEVKLSFEKDSEGEEYDNLVEFQSYEKIDLLVKKTGDKDPAVELTTLNPSPDKYTYYVQNYVGKNAATIGYESLGGDYLDAYGDGVLELNLVADDGSYIDISDETVLKQYVVTSQNIEANSEIKYTYSVDSEGNEYSNLVDTQTYDSITLNVKSVTGEAVVSTKEDASETQAENVEEKEENNTSGTVFEPKDVSDKTIESISTYGDYLAMYRAITDDYLANYENVVKGTVLYDEESFQEMKDEMDESFKEQEEEYGSMKNQKIIGKDSLVDFLKSYRDSLQTMVDSYEESLEAFQ